MATPVDHAKLLDHLQTEVNRVLEQTGRVFAASSSKDNKNSPVAQASRLKLMLPESVNRFHDALDQLEDDLHLAKLAMRRDLALCKALPEPEEEAKDHIAGSGGNADSAMDSEPAQSIQVKQSDNVDVVMGEGDDSTKVQAADVAEDQSGNRVEDPSRDVKHEENSNLAKRQDGDSESKDLQVSTDPSSKNEKTDDSVNKSVSPTKLDATGDDDIPPDTALSNTADLESLFGPTSATIGPNGGDFGGDGNNGDLFDFGFSTNDAGDKEPSGGNDDIEAFLPGLQDYANTHSGEGEDDGGTDFDALFSDFNMPSAENKDNVNKGDEGAGDTTFDELMDFGLDAGDFDAANGTGNQDDFNFDFT